MKIGITRKSKRDTNMELLRIVAMLMVMFYHTNIISLAGEAPTVSNVIKVFWQLTVFGGVDLFIMLSGWFGIRATTEKFFYLAFQVLFFLLFSYFLNLLFNPNVTFSFNFLCHLFMLQGYWFVQSYLFLFVLSPILNLFAEKATKPQFLWLLVMLFSLQTLYGYMLDYNWYQKGASPIFFISLYMLARYIRLYRPNWSIFNKRTDIFIFFSIIFVETLIVFFIRPFDNYERLSDYIFIYLSPLVIISSLFMLLFFSKLSFSNNVVNWLAASCFAAYLLHAAPYFFGLYIDFVYEVHSQTDIFLFIIFYFFYVFSIFLFSVLIDKVRLFLWHRLLFIYHSINSFSK